MLIHCTDGHFIAYSFLCYASHEGNESFNRLANDPQGQVLRIPVH